MPAHFRGLVSNRDGAARLITHIAKVEFIMLSALRFINCAFYDVEDDFGLDESLLRHNGILAYSAPTLVSSTDDLGLLNIVQRTQCDAAKSIFVF